jgi:hydroxyacylglutathione hydrolase
MSKVITLKLGFANAFLIRDKGTILVDTGIYVSKDKYIQLFRELAIDSKEINLIIISHGHADHFAHAYELKKMTGAPILCHKNAIYALQTAQNAAIIPRNILGERVLKMIKTNLPMAAKSVQPDLIMADAFDLNQYGVAGKVIYTPGHTDCSISIILDSGEAVVGDIVVPSPFTGEPCLAYFAYNEKLLLESVKTLLCRAQLFYGGHGGPFTREEILKIIITEPLR